MKSYIIIPVVVKSGKDLLQVITGERHMQQALDEKQIPVGSTVFEINGTITKFQVGEETTRKLDLPE